MIERLPSGASTYDNKEYQPLDILPSPGLFYMLLLNFILASKCTYIDSLFT